MADPFDTIREALEGAWRPIREDGTYAHSSRHEDAMAALTEVEQHLAAERRAYEAAVDDWHQVDARAVAAEAALAEAISDANVNADLVDEQRERAEAAEQRANDLVDALRAYFAERDGWGPDGVYAPSDKTEAQMRAALDRQEQT